MVGHNMDVLSFLIWQFLTVARLLQLCWEPTHLCSLLSAKPAESLSAISSQRRQDVFRYSFWVSSFHSRTLLRATLAISLVISSLKSICCDFYIFSAVLPRLPAPFNLVRNSIVHSPITIFCNQGPKVRKRIHLLQLLILNEYAARYAVALHYFGLVDVDE